MWILAWVLFFKVGKYFLYYSKIFNTGYDFDRSTTFIACLDVNIEYPLESLRPGYSDMAFSLLI